MWGLAGGIAWGSTIAIKENLDNARPQSQDASFFAPHARRAGLSPYLLALVEDSRRRAKEKAGEMISLRVVALGTGYFSQKGE